MMNWLYLPNDIMVYCLNKSNSAVFALCVQWIAATLWHVILNSLFWWNSFSLHISHIDSNVTKIAFIIYFHHLTFDNGENVSLNMRVKFYLNNMALWKYVGISLIIVSTKTIEDTNGYHYYYYYYYCHYYYCKLISQLQMSYR